MLLLFYMPIWRIHCEKGVTYIADRGYFAFDLVAEMTGKGAFFVLRMKDNVKFTLQTTLVITGKIPAYFAQP